MPMGMALLSYQHRNSFPILNGFALHQFFDNHEGYLASSRILHEIIARSGVDCKLEAVNMKLRRLVKEFRSLKLRKRDLPKLEILLAKEFSPPVTAARKRPAPAASAPADPEPLVTGGTSVRNDCEKCPGLRPMPMAMMSALELVEHLGSCHCGAVKFCVKAPADLDVMDCSCSICAKKQNLHFIVPKSQFKLLQGEEKLTTYTFSTHKAKHTFCQVCGVQSFYTPRSNQDGYGIMPHCIDSDTIKSVNIIKFDGKNWENAFEQSDISKYSSE